MTLEDKYEEAKQTLIAIEQWARKDERFNTIEKKDYQLERIHEFSEYTLKNL